MAQIKLLVLPWPAIPVNFLLHNDSNFLRLNNTEHFLRYNSRK